VFDYLMNIFDCRFCQLDLTMRLVKYWLGSFYGAETRASLYGDASLADTYEFIRSVGIGERSAAVQNQLNGGKLLLDARMSMDVCGR
jgi:hypothetical protein